MIRHHSHAKCCSTQFISPSGTEAQFRERVLHDLRNKAQSRDELMYSAWACSDFSVLAGDVWVNEDSAAPRYVFNVTVQYMGMPRRSFLISIYICTKLLPGTYPSFINLERKCYFYLQIHKKSSFGKLVYLQVLVLHPTLLQCYLLLTRIKHYSTCRECTHLQALHALPKSST